MNRLVMVSSSNQCYLSRALTLRIQTGSRDRGDGVDACLDFSRCDYSISHQRLAHLPRPPLTYVKLLNVTTIIIPLLPLLQKRPLLYPPPPSTRVTYVPAFQS